MGEFSAEMNDAIRVVNTDLNETMQPELNGCFPGICRFYRIWQRDQQTLAEGSTRYRQVRWKNFWHPFANITEGVRARA